jgi:hypothetical protein
MPEGGEQMPEKEPPLLPSSVNRPDVSSGSNVPERYHGSPLPRKDLIDVVPQSVIEKRQKEIEESAGATIAQEEINRINAQRIENRRMARERFPKKEEPTLSPQAEGRSTQLGAKAEQPKTKGEAAQQKGKESEKTEESKQETKRNRVGRTLDWIVKKLDDIAEHPAFVAIAGVLGYDEAKELLNVILRRSGQKATETAREAAKKAARALASRKQEGRKDKKVGVETEEVTKEEFEEAPQEKPEREVRPSRIPIPVIPKVEKEEKPKSEKEIRRNFIDIQEEILNFRMPPKSASEEEKLFARQKLGQLFNERTEVYREVRDAGFYKDSVQQILLTISKSKLEEVQRNIKILADSYEDRAMSSEKYRNNTRWQGSVRAGIMGAAVKVTADGLASIIDDREALAKKGMTAKGVVQLMQRARLEHFMGFEGLNPVDYIGLNYQESEGEKIYKRLKEEGQGERDSEKLKREVDELRRKVEENQKRQKREHERGRSRKEVPISGKVEELLTQIRDRTATPEEIAIANKIASAAEEEQVYPLAVRHMYKLPDMELSFPAFLSDEWLSKTGRLDQRRKLRSEWVAIGRLSSACDKKLDQTRPLHPNEEAQLINNENFNNLMAKDGVFEAISLYTVFLMGDENGRRSKYKLNEKEKTISMTFQNKNINEFLLKANPKNKEEEEKRQRLLEITPESFFNSKNDNETKSGVNNNQEFEAIRDSIAYWLTNSRGMDAKEAEMASVVAWNMLYLGNLPEYCSSKFVHYDKDTLTSTVPFLVTTRAWEAIRPQDRFEAKTKSGEAWGPFGAWALKQKNKPLNKTFGWETPNVLPESTIKTPFHYRNFIIDGNEIPLIDVMHSYGTMLLNNPEIKYQAPKLDPQKEGPYADYQFQHLDYAQQFIEYAKKGFGGTDEDLLNIYEKLDFSSGWRDFMTRVLMGKVDANKKSITPTMGWVAWKGYTEQKRKRYPGLFKK